MISEREYWAIIIGAMAFGFMYAAAKDLWKGLTAHAEKAPEVALAYEPIKEFRAGTHLP
ncbi:MAG: hypothetical protein U0744_19470 [Gemmataceae bacterium]